MSTQPEPSQPAHDGPATPPKKAGLGQVIATMAWGMLMVGRKGTWERDGAVLSAKQTVIGMVVTGIVVVSALVLLARWLVTHIASST